MLKIILTKLWCIRYHIPYKFGIFIHPFVKLLGNGTVSLDKNVELHANVLLDTAENGVITIEEGANINSYSRIEAMNFVRIESDVLIGPNVYISDRNHSYKDVNTPIKKQGYYSYSSGGVQIGSETWIGIHTAIIGNVTIGKHCVIGANCVITHDIPSYSVVVGNPGKIIKRYNQESKKWEYFN